MDGRKTPGARGSASGMLLLRVVVAGYLIYLGISLIRGHLDGSSTLPPWLSWLSGLVFALGGAGFIWLTWRQWRAEQKAGAEEPEVPAESEEKTEE